MTDLILTELSKTNLSEPEARVLYELARALREIRYGSVILTVHDGRVVEIQKTEKVRVSSS